MTTKTHKYNDPGNDDCGDDICGLGPDIVLLSCEMLCEEVDDDEE